MNQHAKPLNIAMMIETDGPGGAEVVFIQLSEELRRRGHKIYVVGPERGQGWLSGKLAELGFDRHTFRLRRPLDLRCLRDMTDMLRRLDIDAIHSHEFTMAVYGTAIAKRLGVPHVITMHGSQSVMNALRRRIALRWAFRNSYAPLACSDHTRQDMESRLGLHAGSIGVVRNGVPDRKGDRAHARQALGIPDDDVMILAVGNLSARKAHIILLEAAAKVASMAPDLRWQVVIAGDGSQRPMLESFVEEHGLDARVRLLGQREDVPDLQAAADIYAMPSRWEGLPLVILEGMFASNAIVATDVGGVREAVVHGENGLVVPPGDADRFAQSLRELIEDGETRQRMSAASRRRAERDFSVSAMAVGYENHYRKSD